MVMAVPFLRSLREGFTGELWGIGKTNAMHLYNGLDLFDRFMPYDRKGFVPFLDMVSTVKNTRFDWGIMMPHSFRAALLFYTGNVKDRIGYARNKRGFMLTRQVPEGRRPEPTVEHYLRIIDTIGGKRVLFAPVLAVTGSEEHRYDEKHMDITAPYVAFIIGAQYGPSKRWPDSHFAELADMIVNNFDVRVYLLPGKAEEELAHGILSEVHHKDRVEVKSLDIRDLKVCLSRASAVVTNDTGPRHIAAALGRPTVVLLGPMDEEYTVYPSPHTYPVFRDIPCRPCNRKQCEKGDHECLKGITPKDIFLKVETILNGKN